MGVKKSKQNNVDSRRFDHTTPREKPMCEASFAIYVQGNTGAGQTALLRRMFEQKFDPNVVEQVDPRNGHNVRFSNHVVTYTKNMPSPWELRLELTDRGENFLCISTQFKRLDKADCIMICFDVSSSDFTRTIYSLDRWVNEANQSKGLSRYWSLALVACKADLNRCLMYEPWSDARNILVAMQPRRDDSCPFATLPDEVVDLILLDLVRLRYRDCGCDGEEKLFTLPTMIEGDERLGTKSLDSPIFLQTEPMDLRPRFMNLTDLRTLATRYRSPICITSSKLDVGTEECLDYICKQMIEDFLTDDLI